MPNLRRTLLELLAATAVLPGCYGPCPPSESDEAELVEPLDAELQTLVDRCRTEGGGFDLLACEPMCRELIVRELGEPPFDDLSSCQLSEDMNPATAVTARASWTIGPRCVGGRRPAEYCESELDRSDVGGFLAEQARLEAASVRAFLELARALEAHRAPRVLIVQCRRAAADEIVHAVLVGRLARRYGVAPRIDDGVPGSVPSLEQLALANAVEGCVRETWGAIVATWQAHASTDPAIRAVMQRIAPDETRHATLSRAIHRWAMRRLDVTARARVLTARASALAELAATSCEPPVALAEQLGLPRAESVGPLLNVLSSLAAV